MTPRSVTTSRLVWSDPANPATHKQSSVRGGHCPDTGIEHRRQQRHVQRNRQRAAEISPLPAARTHSPHLPHQRRLSEIPIEPVRLRDFRTRSKSFDTLAAFTRGDRQLSGNSGEPEHFNGFRVTSGYFRALGLHPQLGHEFDEKAEIPGNELQVTLSNRLWRTQFGAATDILGRKITLNSQPYTVVGVMTSEKSQLGNR